MLPEGWKLHLPGGIDADSTRALVGLLERWDDLGPARVLVWRIASVDESALPHLAQGLGVDGLEFVGGPPREFVSRAVDLMRRRGTAGAVEEALAAIGYGADVVELVEDTRIYYDGAHTYSGEPLRYGQDGEWIAWYARVAGDVFSVEALRELWDVLAKMNRATRPFVLVLEASTGKVTVFRSRAELVDVDANAEPPPWTPAELDLSLWLRDYAGAPWAGTASAGASGSRSATSGGMPPSSLVLDGHGAANCDGIDDYLVLPGTAADYYTADAYSGWAVIRNDTASGDSDVPYVDDHVIADTGAYLGLVIRARGDMGVFHDYGGDKVAAFVRATMGGRASGIVTWRYDGTRLAIGWNGPPVVSVAASPITAAALTRTMRLAINYAGSYYHGVIRELALSKAAISDANFDAVVAYAKDRYAIDAVAGTTAAIADRWRPDIGATISAGKLVALQDQVGDRDQSQAQPLNAPSVAADAAYGGQDVIVYDGTTSQWFDSGAGELQLRAPVSILVVGHASEGTRSFVSTAESLTYDMIWRTNNAAIEFFAGPAVDTPGGADAGPCAILFTDDGSAAEDAAKLFVDDLATAKGTSPTRFLPATQIQLGRGVAGVQHLKGQLAEVVYWRGVLADEDKTAVAAYVAERYGLAVTA